MNNTDWQQLWTDQSKIFMDTANKNFEDLFAKNAQLNPEQYQEQIQEWVANMNKQWADIYKNCGDTDQAKYWEAMAQTSKQASEMMLEQWMKRAQQDDPIKSVKELYELWLSSCHDIYMKNIQSNAYQQMYGDMLNDAMKYWKSGINK